MAYILAWGVLIAAYITIVLQMKRMKNTKLFNCIFACGAYIPYPILMFVVYQSVGASDWNFLNTLPTANVSPFMFSIIPLTFLFPKNIKKYLYLLISLLSVYGIKVAHQLLL